MVKQPVINAIEETHYILRNEINLTKIITKYQYTYLLMITLKGLWIMLYQLKIEQISPVIVKPFGENI